MITATALEAYDAGCAYIGLQQWDNAIAAFEKAIMLQPNYPTAYNNRGNALQNQERFFDAVLNYNHAIAFDSKSPDIFNNRGAALQSVGDYEGALRDYKIAISLRKDGKHEQAWTNSGNVLKLMGRVPEAKEAYQNAILANQEYVEAHLNKSFIQLELGEYAEGWKEYEWRWKSGQLPSRGFKNQKWMGEDLTGKSILLYGEQGLGDVLQFLRYVPMVKARGAREVIVEVRPPCLRIAQTVEGVDKVVAHGDDIIDEIDFNSALMSLPHVFGTTVETIPNKVPYISAPQDGIAFWRDTFAQYPGLKVGICWAGSKRPLQPAANAVDKRRSTNLSQWAPLGGIKDVTFVSLQREQAAEQGQNPPPGIGMLNVAKNIDDFSDTAALVANLDLVIAVDTAIIHLAGALGKPVWLASRFDNCWRWLGSREDSPWYPTLRQFIQPSPGDWNSLFVKISEELRKFVIEQTRITVAA